MGSNFSLTKEETSEKKEEKMNESSNPPAVWVPSVLEISMAQVAVLRDPFPTDQPLDAIFIHATPFTADEPDQDLLRKVAALQLGSKVKNIVITGLPSVAPYRGAAKCCADLCDSGVSECFIHSIPEAKHTAAETIAFMEMAKRMGWSRLAVSSQAHHQLRVFLQAVAVMATMNFRPKVWNFTNEVGWNHPGLSKVQFDKNWKVIGSVDTDLGGHVREELVRIEKYAQEPPVVDGLPAYTRHATVPEMLAYLAWRG